MLGSPAALNTSCASRRGLMIAVPILGRRQRRDVITSGRTNPHHSHHIGEHALMSQCEIDRGLRASKTRSR